MIPRLIPGDDCAPPIDQSTAGTLTGCPVRADW
jgi:hypothetical protein